MRLAPRIRASILLALGLVLLRGPVAEAVIPLADRTMKAIAEVNRASGRSQALQLELTIRIGDEPPIGSGELISHPSGLARLEIRRHEGQVERYLLSGAQLLGTMNGRSVSRPRPLLQPLFLLQLASEVTLRAALESFGIQSDSIGLAPCGEQDCFVIGDPRLAAPLPLPAPPPESGVLGDPLTDLDGTDLDATDPEGSEGEQTDPQPEEAGFLDLGGPSELLLGDAPGDSPEDSLDTEVMNGRLPRLWVDTQQLEVRRIDRADGVYVVFGPTVSFDRLKLPSWFEVHEPEEAFPIRFEVDRAVQVSAPPKAFSRSWLALRDLAGDPEDPN
ncbi:MAG: hypothetical protein JRJ58_02360 [Deltaproteobacteria bacterium]|nr:hypothetical protein [Deltaproteobacteria bacterium]